MIIRNFTSNLLLDFSQILSLQIALSFELVHLLECIRSANTSYHKLFYKD
jgi:hypothetical protein